MVILRAQYRYWAKEDSWCVITDRRCLIHTPRCWRVPESYLTTTKGWGSWWLTNRTVEAREIDRYYANVIHVSSSSAAEVEELAEFVTEMAAGVEELDEEAIESPERIVMRRVDEARRVLLTAARARSP